MDTQSFVNNFRKAFGNYELPVAFWYSDEPAAKPEKTLGCFVKNLKPAREGNVISLNGETISCGGGKIYTGFSAPLPHIPEFVSLKEKYKESPEMVTDFIKNFNLPDKSGQYINFVTIDKLDNFDNLEGLIFFATPDVLSGLICWVLFDTNKPDAVSVPFGSGCSSMIAQTVVENKNNGYRTFLGLFDPSVRPAVESNILSLSVPMSRFKELYNTFNKSCLQGTHAWGKVKKRIEENESK